MNSIVITVPGEELENLNIELSAEEVTALYKLRKENAMRIAELEKGLDEADKLKKMYSDNADKAQNELNQAHTLLTALGVQEKTNDEEVYYRKALPIPTRIALYIALLKG